MPYVYLISSVFLAASSTVFGKVFTRRCNGRKGAEQFYNFLFMISVCLGWGVMLALDFSFDVTVLVC